MNPPSNTNQQSTGPVGIRKPWTAANLSLVLSGLGQICCGVFRRGICHMCIMGTSLAFGMVAFALEWSNLLTVLMVTGVVAILTTCYSSLDAFRLARRTREDYRLKDYNRLSVYSGLFFLFFISIIAFAFILRANVIQAFVMVGDSMSPTIDSGDRVIVRKDEIRERLPELGEIIVFRNPEKPSQHYIKRVVGLPGDKVEIKAGVIRVNGEILDTGVVDKNAKAEVSASVPMNHCYVIGDHLSNSKDSRHFGPLPMVAIEGKILWIW